MAGQNDILKKKAHAMKVTQNLTLACLLEASVPKPGNVSPIHAFHSTRYEHYLAGSVSVGLTLGKLASPDANLSVGWTVLEAVKNNMKSHGGGNTHLGIILLLGPLAKASTIEVETPDQLRNNLKRILDKLDFVETEMFFKAINMANPGGLLPVDELDVRDYSTLKEIQERKIKVREFMKVSEDQNSVSYEFVNDYALTFDIGLPYFTLLQTMDEPVDINRAILMLYFKFLSERPDSLVMGKFDLKTAENVQSKAKELLNLFERGDSDAGAELDKFTGDLNSKKINPGMTADLTAVTLYVALMMGLKL
jgi:triphosphoribosyl-dephospho-CoA synthase